jgi:mRNA interferase RelE/StbE
LSERLTRPHIPLSQRSGFENHYKTKLRASRYRLIYEVLAEEIVVMAIAVDKRDKGFVYKKAHRRK